MSEPAISIPLSDYRKLKRFSKSFSGFKRNQKDSDTNLDGQTHQSTSQSPLLDFAGQSSTEPNVVQYRVTLSQLKFYRNQRCLLQIEWNDIISFKISKHFNTLWIVYQDNFHRRRCGHQSKRSESLSYLKSSQKFNFPRTSLTQLKHCSSSKSLSNDNSVTSSQCQLRHVLITLDDTRAFIDECLAWGCFSNRFPNSSTFQYWIKCLPPSTVTNTGNVPAASDWQANSVWKCPVELVYDGPDRIQISNRRKCSAPNFDTKITTKVTKTTVRRSVSCRTIRNHRHPISDYEEEDDDLPYYQDILSLCSSSRTSCYSDYYEPLKDCSETKYEIIGGSDKLNQKDLNATRSLEQLLSANRLKRKLRRSTISLGKENVPKTCSKNDTTNVESKPVVGLKSRRSESLKIVKNSDLDNFLHAIQSQSQKPPSEIQLNPSKSKSLKKLPLDSSGTNLVMTEPTISVVSQEEQEVTFKSKKRKKRRKSKSKQDSTSIVKLEPETQLSNPVQAKIVETQLVSLVPSLESNKVPLISITNRESNFQKTPRKNLKKYRKSKLPVLSPIIEMSKVAESPSRSLEDNVPEVLTENKSESLPQPSSSSKKKRSKKVDKTLKVSSSDDRSAKTLESVPETSNNVLDSNENSCALEDPSLVKSKKHKKHSKRSPKTSKQSDVSLKGQETLPKPQNLCSHRKIVNAKKASVSSENIANLIDDSISKSTTSNSLSQFKASSSTDIRRYNGTMDSTVPTSSSTNIRRYNGTMDSTVPTSSSTDIRRYNGTMDSTVPTSSSTDIRRYNGTMDSTVPTSSSTDIRRYNGTMDSTMDSIDLKALLGSTSTINDNSDFKAVLGSTSTINDNSDFKAILGSTSTINDSSDFKADLHSTPSTSTNDISDFKAVLDSPSTTNDNKDFKAIFDSTPSTSTNDIKDFKAVLDSPSTTNDNSVFKADLDSTPSTTNDISNFKAVLGSTSTINDNSDFKADLDSTSSTSTNDISDFKAVFDSTHPRTANDISDFKAVLTSTPSSSITSDIRDITEILDSTPSSTTNDIDEFKAISDSSVQPKLLNEELSQMIESNGDDDDDASIFPLFNDQSFCVRCSNRLLSWITTVFINNFFKSFIDDSDEEEEEYELSTQSSQLDLTNSDCSTTESNVDLDQPVPDSLDYCPELKPLSESITSDSFYSVLSNTEPMPKQVTNTLPNSESQYLCSNCSAKLTRFPPANPLPPISNCICSAFVTTPTSDVSFSQFPETFRKSSIEVPANTSGSMKRTHSGSSGDNSSTSFDQTSLKARRTHFFTSKATLLKIPESVVQKIVNTPLPSNEDQKSKESTDDNPTPSSIENIENPCKSKVPHSGFDFSTNVAKFCTPKGYSGYSADQGYKFCSVRPNLPVLTEISSGSSSAISQTVEKISDFQHHTESTSTNDFETKSSESYVAKTSSIRNSQSTIYDSNQSEKLVKQEEYYQNSTNVVLIYRNEKTKKTLNMFSSEAPIPSTTASDDNGPSNATLDSSIPSATGSDIRLYNGTMDSNVPKRSSTDIRRYNGTMDSNVPKRSSTDICRYNETMDSNVPKRSSTDIRRYNGTMDSNVPKRSSTDICRYNETMDSTIPKSSSTDIRRYNGTIDSSIPSTTANDIRPSNGTIDSSIPSTTANDIRPSNGTIDSSIPSTTANDIRPSNGTIDSSIPSTTANDIRPSNGTIDSSIPSTTANDIRPSNRTLDSLIPSTTANDIRPSNGTLDSLIPSTTASDIRPSNGTMDSSIPSTTANDIRPSIGTLDSSIPSTTANDIRPSIGTLDSLIPSTTASDIRPSNETMDSLIPSTTSSDIRPSNATLDSSIPPATSSNIGPTNATLASSISTSSSSGSPSTKNSFPTCKVISSITKPILSFITHQSPLKTTSKPPIKSNLSSKIGHLPVSLVGTSQSHYPTKVTAIAAKLDFLSNSSRFYCPSGYFKQAEISEGINEHVLSTKILPILPISCDDSVQLHSTTQLDDSPDNCDDSVQLHSTTQLNDSPDNFDEPSQPLVSTDLNTSLYKNGSLVSFQDYLQSNNLFDESSLAIGLTSNNLEQSIQPPLSNNDTEVIDEISSAIGNQHNSLVLPNFSLQTNESLILQCPKMAENIEQFVFPSPPSTATIAHNRKSFNSSSTSIKNLEKVSSNHSLPTSRHSNCVKHPIEPSIFDSPPCSSASSSSLSVPELNMAQIMETIMSNIEQLANLVQLPQIEQTPHQTEEYQKMKSQQNKFQDKKPKSKSRFFSSNLLCCVSKNKDYKKIQENRRSSLKIVHLGPNYPFVNHQNGDEYEDKDHQMLINQFRSLQLWAQYWREAKQNSNSNGPIQSEPNQNETDELVSISFENSFDGDDGISESRLIQL